MPPPPFPHHHLLGIESLTSEDIYRILDLAKSLGAPSEPKFSHVLKDRLIINLFLEGSTRTRTSFEIAERRLGAHIVNFDVESSSSKKGETLLDTALNLEATGADMMVIRHSAPGVPHFLSRHLGCHLINAGDGSHEHPTQALLDAYTLREHFGKIEGLRIAIVGDIRNSRVARSTAWLLTKLGAHVSLVAPPTLLPKELQTIWPEAQLTSDLDRILPHQDAFIMLRIQTERGTNTLIPTRKEYVEFYQMNSERFARALKTAVIMHPGPVNHGVELTSELFNDPRSLILKQVAFGVPIRMAVIQLLFASRTN